MSSAIVPAWSWALVRRRKGQVLAASAGVALAVALFASLGSFLSVAKGEMSDRAVSTVGVDWQVDIAPTTKPGTVEQALLARPGVLSALPVGYGGSDGFEATVDGATHTTGGGVVVGLPSSYAHTFPSQLRLLAGSLDGVVVAQQTAANLAVRPGDTVRISPSGGAPAVEVAVGGIVDLPQIDSFFQHVGAPSGAQATAPPDNVVIVPSAQWHDLYPATAGGAHTEFHVRLAHRLPADPATAYVQTLGAGHRLEADLAGAAVVGNNLAAALDAARSDAAYAQVLFVLLGFPGVALALFLTRTIVAAGSPGRRRAFALLRTRGASATQIVRVATAEGALVAAAGGLAGLLLGAALGQVAFHSATFGVTKRAALEWTGASLVIAAVTAMVAVAAPARRDSRAVSVAEARRAIAAAPRGVAPLWLVVTVLTAAAATLWATSRSHYDLVLAPEGVPTVSLSYWAFAGPLLLWIGTGLLAWRVADAALGSKRLSRFLRPLGRDLASTAAATIRRQHRTLASGVVLLVLAVGFAVSTSVFDTTYRHQSRADAILTNGAPVTVTDFAPDPRGDARERAIRRTAGVGGVETLSHRFVYVGSDLQDLYGVDPTTIARGGALQNGYFSGGSARSLMRRLQQRPDSVLVSAETVQDFQLQLGDAVTLRVRDPRSGNLEPVTFHYAGVVKEFPTAPSDSFIVANAQYVAAKTTALSAATYLVTPRNTAPATLALRLQSTLGPAAAVTTADEAGRLIGSSLTAVDLTGLTKVELTFAGMLVSATTGVVLTLGFMQRRRSLAIMRAIGAREPQLAIFPRSEAILFGSLGLVLGALAGWLLAVTLVKVLTGVFDPPPEALRVPWRYLATTAAAGLGGLVLAVRVQLHQSRRPLVELVRDL